MEGTNQKPWQGLGAEIDAQLSPHEMLVKAGLDYKRPYKSPANHETFRFIKAFAEAGEAHIRTVGQLDNGRIVWVLAGLDAPFTLPGADSWHGCLLFASRNEKRDTVSMQVTAVRDVCHTTLQIPSPAKTIFKNTFRREFIPTPPFLSPAATHLDEEMIEKAKENIGLARDAITAFAADAERLANHPVDEVTAHRYILDAFQPDAVRKGSTPRLEEIKQLADKKTGKAMAAIETVPGRDMTATTLTAWSLLNTVAYTVDHQLSKNQDSRLRLAWFGSHADIKKRAFDLALKLL